MDNGAQIIIEPDRDDLNNLDETASLHALIASSKLLYEKNPTIRCPYFEGDVTLNADGFNHLLYKPNRQPRNVKAQLLKLRLLKKALRVIQKAGTIQEYRVKMERFGKSGKDGFTKTKQVEYWAFHHIVGEQKKFLIRVIIRRIGDGKLHFWSVMPNGKIERQKLYSEGMDEEEEQ